MGHWSCLHNICSTHSTLFPPSSSVWLGLTPSQLQQRALTDMSLSSNPVPLLQGWAISAQHFPGYSDWAHDLRWSKSESGLLLPQGRNEGREHSFFLPLSRWEQKEHSPQDFWKPTYYHGKNQSEEKANTRGQSCENLGGWSQKPEDTELPLKPFLKFTLLLDFSFTEPIHFLVCFELFIFDNLRLTKSYKTVENSIVPFTQLSPMIISYINHGVISKLGD